MLCSTDCHAISVLTTRKTFPFFVLLVVSVLHLLPFIDEFHHNKSNGNCVFFLGFVVIVYVRAKCTIYYIFLNTVIILVLTVPTATILGGPDLYVDIGSTINLTCAIQFSPEPPTHIFWYHQDKVSCWNFHVRHFAFGFGFGFWEGWLFTPCSIVSVNDFWMLSFTQMDSGITYSCQPLSIDIPILSISHGCT